MSRFFLPTIFMIGIVCSFADATYSHPCFSECKFNFCDYSTKLEISEPDAAVTAPICMGKTKIGVVGSTGEAFRYHGHRFTPISKWYPAGLQQYYSPSFFKAFTFDNYDDYPGYSGVGCEETQKNQLDFLDDECWVLPINAYQVLNKEGNVIENVHTSGKDAYKYCIAFKTEV